MYAVSAGIQGAGVIAVPLLADREFALDEQAVLDRCTSHVKLVFLCSPNNPTGNLLSHDSILRLTRALDGRAIVVVDEAYIEFSGAQSLARHIRELPYLAILRTLSKAHALAGARCGTLIADPEVVSLLRKIIPPYPIARLSIEAIVKVLEPTQLAVSRSRLEVVRSERERLLATLSKMSSVTKVWPSASNFILAEFADAALALARTRGANLLIRDARGYPGLGGCLRMSIGTPEQNDRLLAALQ
jgi:histidinol-phosphate aminotransferase